MGLPPSKEPGESGGAGGLAEISQAIQRENEQKPSDEARERMATAGDSAGAAGGGGRGGAPGGGASRSRARARTRRAPEPEPVTHAAAPEDELENTMWDRITRLELADEYQQRYSRNVRTIALGAFLLACMILAVFVIFRFRLLPKLIANAIKGAPKAAAAVA
jgi:hypothetical protein